MKDMFRSMKCATIAAILVAVFAIAIQAQTQGEITGLVTDPKGEVTPGANVSVTNKATGAVRKVTTNGEGLYAFPSLPPGPYVLKVELNGFKISLVDNIQLEVQQTARLDVTLEVGQVGETVTVDSAAATLNTENGTLGTVIENRIVTDLPLNGRQYLNLVALTPNANVLAPSAGQAGARQGGERAQQSISAGGQRIFFNYYTLDGVNNMDVNFNTYVALPSIDAIQEFKIQVGVYPAEYGHQSTQVNVLTKSGGNAYHGTLFEFLRNDKFDANQYQFTAAKPKNPFKWNDYGFEVDGPVRIPYLFNGKDKLFFMGNYEALRRKQSVLNPFTVPTTKMFAGDFSELLPSTIIYDPLTGLPFAGNIIPANRIDPISQKFLKYYNSSPVRGTNNFTQTSAQPFDRFSYVMRFDFIESTKSQWMGRYNWGNDLTSTQGLNTAGTKVLTNYKQWAISNTRTINSNLVNEARFGYTKFFNSLGTLSATVKDVVAEIGIPNQKSGDPITWGIPNVVFNGAGLTAIGDANDGPFKNDNNSLQFFDKVSWIHGKHTFTFGGEFSRQHFNQVGNQFSRGVFTFQASATVNPANPTTGGHAFADFLLGKMFTSTNAAAVADAKFTRNVFHAFVDDTWKVTPKLTLSLGLRYELTPPFTNTLGNYFTVEIPKIEFVANAPQADWPFFVRQGKGCTDPYEGLNIRWTSTKAVCGGGLNNNLRKTQHTDFAPRIGVAYSFDDKTVIRAGFGVFYMQDIANAEYFDMARNIAARVDLQTTTATPITWSNSIPGGTSTIVQVPPPFAWAAAYEHITPRTYQYMFNIQRQLGSKWYLELGYLGSQSRHLYGFQNVNQALPGPLNSINSRRPFANFGVLSFVNDVFRGSYNAGSVKLTRRFGDGISLNTNYTWAKSIDNASGTRTQGLDTLFPQDSSCLECEKGLSSFDVRHRWVMAALYDLPIGKGKMLDIKNSVANAFVGGWQLSANATIQSGVPQTLTIGINNAGTNNPLPDRPSYSGVGSGYLSTGIPTRQGLSWFDPASFVVAPQGSFGSVGRNTMITPHFQSIDMALAKRFTIAERHVIQFRVEAFNVFNHPSWGAPNGNILAGDPFPGAPANAAHQGFGIINSTSIPMRQIQFGLKYSF